MPEIEYTSLVVPHPSRRSIPNRLLKQTGPTRALMVIFPGLNYSCDNPLLYYLSRLALDRSADVLQLWANYTISEFQSLSKQEQVRWLLEDAISLIGAGRNAREYERLALVGKSIGTLTLGALFAQVKEVATAPAIWLTPLFHYEIVMNSAMQAKGKSLFVCGSGDPTYDVEAMNRIETLSTARSVTIQNANHSLEIPEDMGRSLEALQTIMAAASTFLDDSFVS